MSKQVAKKHRHFSMTTYISLDDIREYVKNDSIEKYAYILHDKDDSQPHYHLVVSYKNPRTWEGVKKDFAKYEQNTCVEVVKSLDGVLDYLTHKNQPEKYQYTEEAVTNCGYYRGDYRRNVDLTQDVAITITEAILDGMTKRELLKRFGREYVINRRHYESLALDIYNEESNYVYDENKPIEQQKTVYKAVLLKEDNSLDCDPFKNDKKEYKQDEIVCN